MEASVALAWLPRILTDPATRHIQVMGYFQPIAAPY